MLALIEKEVRSKAASLTGLRILKLQRCVQVANGIPFNRVVMGGFSQGAALSLFTGFQIKKALAGVLVLSGYIPKQEVRLPSYLVSFSS